jgi:hypothetical protein
MFQQKWRQQKHGKEADAAQRRSTCGTNVYGALNACLSKQPVQATVTSLQQSARMRVQAIVASLQQPAEINHAIYHRCQIEHREIPARDIRNRLPPADGHAHGLSQKPLDSLDKRLQRFATSPATI